MQLLCSCVLVGDGSEGTGAQPQACRRAELCLLLDCPTR